LGASLPRQRSVREGEPDGTDHLDLVAVVDRLEVVAEVLTAENLQPHGATLAGEGIKAR